MPGLSLSAGLGSLGDVIRQARKDKMQREAFEDARAEAAVQRGAETAVGNGLGSLPAGLASLAQASPPTPGAAPGQAPIALQPSTVSAMRGLSPQAAAGLAALNGSGAAAPQGASPQGGPQGGATPGQMPQPGAPPAKPPPVPGLSSVAQADAAGMDNVVSAGLQTLKSISQSVKAGNPGIDGRTLFLATQRQVEMLKGITPELKESMTYQLKLADLDNKQKRTDAYVANIHSEMEGRLAKATTDAERLQIMQDAVDKTYAARMAGIEEHREATHETNATRVTTTGMNNQTSRDNNVDTQAGEDRRAAARNATTRAASADAAARSAYAANMKVTRNPAKAKAAAAAARAEWKRANSSTPDYEGMGGKKAPDGHWYKPNTGPDKATHPYIQLDA